MEKHGTRISRPRFLRPYIWYLGPSPFSLPTSVSARRNSTYDGGGGLADLILDGGMGLVLADCDPFVADLNEMFDFDPDGEPLACPGPL